MSTSTTRVSIPLIRNALNTALSDVLCDAFGDSDHHQLSIPVRAPDAEAVDGGEAEPAISMPAVHIRTLPYLLC